jgi:putative tryptophan/tyrosine transport system substrate-binding protein
MKTLKFRFSHLCFFLVACLLLLAASANAVENNPKKNQSFRIAIIDFREPQLSDLFRKQIQKAFEEEFEQSKYSISVDYHQITLPSLNLDGLLQEIVNKKPDAIYSTTIDCAKNLRALNADIPIIFSGAIDPKAAGLISSFERPGQNMTGFISFSETFETRRRLIVESSPNVQRIGVICEPSQFSLKTFERWSDDAKSINLKIVPIEFSLEATDENIQLSIARAQVDAFDLPASTLLRRKHKTIINAINATQKPSIYPYESYVKAGGLMSYSHVEPDFAKVAARYIRMAADTTNVGEISVQLPSVFRFSINLDTAKGLRNPIAKSFVKRADLFFP